VFQKIIKFIPQIHKHALNTCGKVLIQIALYFELQKKDKFLAMYRDDFLSENYLFCTAQNTTYCSPKFLPCFGMLYSLRPQISVYLAQKSVYKRVYFSLFNAYLSSKKCFSLIILESRSIIFSHFSICT
jgi:hypothetical protein